MSDENTNIPKKPAGTPDDPYDPLQYFIALFEGRKGAAAVKKQRADTIEGVLKDRIIDGDKKAWKTTWLKRLKRMNRCSSSTAFCLKA